MLRSTGLAVGLLLAACSGQPGVSLPLAAPEGVAPLVKDFIEVCSRAMTEGTDARAEAVKRGWKEMDQASEMLAHGLIMLENEDGDRQLQIVETAYPHLRVRSCMALQMYADEPVDIALIGKTANLVGKITEMPSPDGNASRGAWSFIGPEGDVVVVNATSTPPRVVQMNMSTSKRMSPPKT